MENQNHRTFNKVAQITLLFWLMKIIATTLGKTLGDFIAQTLNLGYVAGLGITFVFFLLALLLQLKSKKYTPAWYWLVIIGTTTLGTEISDFIDRSLHLGYALGSLVLIAALSVTLFLWYRRYDNLEVYPIFERTKELYFGLPFCFRTVWARPSVIS